MTLRFPASFHPPLVYWVSVIFHAVFGRGLSGAQMTTCFFIAVLLLSTYGAGKLLWGEKAGLLAEFLAGASPGILFYCPYFMLDIPLAALVMLSLFLLIGTGGFRDRNYSILFGVSIGLGALVKNTHFLYILPAFLAAALPGLLKSLPGRKEKITFALMIAGFIILFILTIGIMAAGSPLLSWVLLFIMIGYLAAAPLFYKKFKGPNDPEPVRRLANIAFALGIGLFLAWPWYSVNWASSMETYHRFAIPPVAGDLANDSRGHLQLNLLGKNIVLHAGFYLRYLVNCEFLPGAFWLFLISIPLVLFRKDGRSGRPLIWCLLLVFIILTLSPIYGNRYLVPFAALASLPVAYLVFTLRRPAWLVIPIVIIGLVQTLGWIPPVNKAASLIPKVSIVTRTEYGDQALLDIPPGWAYSPFRMRIFKPFETAPEKYSRVKEILGELPADACMILGIDEYGAWFFRAHAMLESRKFTYLIPITGSENETFQYNDSDPFNCSGKRLYPTHVDNVLIQDTLKYDPSSGKIDCIGDFYPVHMQAAKNLVRKSEHLLRPNLKALLYSKN